MSDISWDEVTFYKVTKNTKDWARTVHLLHHPLQQIKFFFHLKAIFIIFNYNLNIFYIFPLLN